MTSAFDKSSPEIEQRAASTPSQFAAFGLLLKGAIALGVILRFVWVQKRELWYDEVLSVLLSSGQKNAYRLPENAPIRMQEISQLLSIPVERNSLIAAKDVVKGTLGDPHPPLFYLMQHSWMRLFGNGEGALRYSIVLISIAALWAAYETGKRVIGQRGALVFTALLALNPFFLSHSLNLRMYAPLVLWVLSGAACLLALADRKHTTLPTHGDSAREKSITWLLRIGLAGSLTAGLLTHYLFTYWLFGISALALYLDRKRWHQHGLTIGAGILFFVPWVLWGTRQQVHNRRDVLTQISAVGGPLQAVFQHGKDLAQTLANHLLLGHLTTSMLPMSEAIKPTAVAVGCALIGFLAFCIVSLYRRRQHRVLTVSLLMGALPLLMALAIDTAANKYTLGFGWGRSVMVALPGCLLLVAAWLELGTARRREAWISLILAVYLAVNLGDWGIGGLGGRDRQMFHALSDRLITSAHPTLIALDTKAWGHVLRLAYYLQAPVLADSAEVDLLATNPEEMSGAIGSALEKKDYAQVLWLHAEYPLWAQAETAAAAESWAAQTQAALETQRVATSEPQVLHGTMNLDEFVLHEYR